MGSRHAGAHRLADTISSCLHHQQRARTILGRGPAVRGAVRRSAGRFAFGLDVVHRLHEAMSQSDFSRSVPPPATLRSKSFQAPRQDCAYPDGDRALTAELLPERLREEFGIDFGEREQRSTDRARRGSGASIPGFPCACARWALIRRRSARLQGDKQPDLAVCWLTDCGLAGR